MGQQGAELPGAALGGGGRTVVVQELHGSSSGRRALASWLGTEPAPPELEFDAMVRLTFAEGR